jgi:hypothetical protein
MSKLIVAIRSYVILSRRHFQPHNDNIHIYWQVIGPQTRGVSTLEMLSDYGGISKLS